VIKIPRGAINNRAVHLNEHIVPSSLKDRGVNDNAEIREYKFYFYDGGHDHTGGRKGSLIGFEWNLVGNGSFDHNISCTTGVLDPSGTYDEETLEVLEGYEGASGVADFWLVSGEILPMWSSASYRGDYSQLLITKQTVVVPTGTHCLYQDVPTPLGYDEHNLPADSDFDGQYVTLGLWSCGEGLMYFGIRDDAGEHWSDAVTLATGWEWNQESFEVSTPSGELRVMVSPSGKVYVDQLQMVLGTRLPSATIYESEKDTDAWRKHNTVFVNCEQDNVIKAGDAVVVSGSSRAGVEHAGYYGQGGVLGVAIAPSSFRQWVAVCNIGIARVNVIRAVTYGDTLCVANNVSYPGYSIAESQLTPSDVTIGDVYTYATALEEKSGTGAGTVLAFVHPKPSRLTNNVKSSLKLAPEYNNSVERSIDGDNPIPMEMGYDGQHNFYKWNLTEAQGRNRFVLEENVPVSVSGAYVFSGVLPASMEMDVDRLYSNEVYQEGLVVGELGKIWGMQVDRVPARVINSNMYTDEDVVDSTDPAHGGSGVPEGWESIGFDLYSGVIDANGTLTVDGLTLYVDIDNASGTINGWLVAGPTGSYMNSITTRLPVPKDFISWSADGLRIWSMADDDGGVEVTVIDPSGDEVLDTGLVTNSGWYEDVYTISGGTFSPDDWFTIQTRLRSTGDNSSYIGEMSLYYHNYSA
jgi:hypothetical protein